MAQSNLRRIFRLLGRRVLFPASERAWTLAFSIVGLALRPRLVFIRPTGHDRVLVIAPHPDDETIGCGGAIALHALAGDDVTACVVTDGGSSRAEGLPIYEVPARRYQEAEAAVGLLGNCRLIQLGLAEGGWDQSRLYGELEAILDRLKPTIVYATSVVDYHPEHTRVASVLADLLHSKPHLGPRLLRVYEVQVPLTPILWNVAADISPVMERKQAALQAYKSQQQSLAWLPRQARYRRALSRARGPIEVFWDMSPAAYSVLCRKRGRLPQRFFGIRPRPLTDGWAWLSGAIIRVRVKRLTRGH